MKYYIGLDVGGTKCAVSLGAEENGVLEVRAREEFPTAGLSPADASAYMLALAKPHLASYAVDGIGISCGSPLDSARGIILSPPNLPGWDNVEVVRYFEDTTGIRAYLENDANACAVAEWRYGAGRGTRNMAFCTFGTGFGAGLILNGQLYSGASGGAGEIGHVRIAQDGPVGYGKAGSVEGFCSGGGIRKMALARIARGECRNLAEKAGGTDNVSAKLIAELARQGDEDCLDIWKTCGEKLGASLAILVDIVNPEMIVLGGIYMRSADLVRDHMLRALECEALAYTRSAVRIVPAELGERVGDYAALSLAAGGY